MHILPFTFTFVLITSLSIPVAMAQDITPPNREHRQGMSYEEYASYREKIRMRMEKMTPAERKQTQEMMNRQSDQMERPKQDSAYGKGFHTRNRLEDRPASDIRSRSDRPDRPKVEKVDRVEKFSR